MAKRFQGVWIVMVLVLMNFSISAQDWSDFKTIPEFQANEGRQLQFRLSGTQFVRNNEFFNEFTEGFTGIGFFLRPQLELVHDTSSRIVLGLHGQKFAGLDTLSQLLPIVTYDIQINPHWRMVLGSIYGALNHEIDEPLYRYDRYYQNNVEYGIQFLGTNPRWQTDTWLSWEKYIFKDDPHQEEFTFGSKNIFRAAEGENWRLKPSFLGMVKHKGGQFNESELPVYLLLAGVLGAKLEVDREGHEWSVEAKHFHYKKNNSKDAYYTGSNSGHGVYYRLGHRKGGFEQLLGYWQGHRFASLEGEYLFSSDSERWSDIYEAKRELITAKVSHSLTFGKHLKGHLRLDTYTDINTGDFAFSTSLFVFLDEVFELWKGRKQ